jgi:transcriptional regulator with XRE-family HTH domain
VDASVLVRTARRQAALTLRELAARAGTSHPTIAAYESGAKVPTVDTLERVLTAAGYAVDVVLEPRVRGDSLGDRGSELVAVLELAGSFPARHARRLTAAPFPTPRARPRRAA